MHIHDNETLSLKFYYLGIFFKSNYAHICIIWIFLILFFIEYNTTLKNNLKFNIKNVINLFKI